MKDTLFDLTGKVALITGATKGIGEATARRMAQHGAKVVVSSRKEEACNTVAESINAEYGKGTALGVACDISHKDQLQALVDKANAAFGAIHVLVANAAINPYFGPSKDLPDAVFAKTMHANVVANHQLAHMVLEQMAQRKDGVVILVASIGGLRGSPILGSYATSKAALMQVARNLSVEFGPDNIRVNAIAPGLVKTYFARALWDNPEILAQTTQGTPLGRIGEPDEIAGMAVLLASKAGAFLTGQTLVIDGGRVIS